MYGLTCTGLVKYNGQKAIRRDIDLLSSALRGVRTEEAFITAGVTGNAADPAQRTL